MRNGMEWNNPLNVGVFFHHRAIVTWPAIVDAWTLFDVHHMHMHRIAFISEKLALKEQKTSFWDFTLRFEWKPWTLGSFLIFSRVFISLIADAYKSRSQYQMKLIFMRVANWSHWLNRSNCAWEMAFYTYATLGVCVCAPPTHSIIRCAKRINEKLLAN